MIRKVFGVTAAAALLVGGSVAVASPASAAPLQPAVGVTALIANVPTVQSLVHHNVSAYSLEPGGSELLIEGKPGPWVAAFPVVGLEKSKRVTHMGGIVFAHMCHTDPHVALYAPTINLAKAKISADVYVNGESVGRKNIFAISGGTATPNGFDDVKVKFLAGVPTFLNETMCTSAFWEGQRFGKADVEMVVL